MPRARLLAPPRSPARRGSPERSSRRTGKKTRIVVVGGAAEVERTAGRHDAAAAHARRALAVFDETRLRVTLPHARRCLLRALPAALAGAARERRMGLLAKPDELGLG